MTYDEAISYLHSLQRFGMKPGLERTRELLERLGRPDRRCGRIIHITGTSGKGSVSALCAAALQAAGHKTGLYTSPSLEYFTDRMQINRQAIPETTLGELVGRVKPHVEAMAAEGQDQPTEFEVTTAVAFLYFAQEQVDYLVLEVGLGGRFDATTVVDTPLVTCITNIGLDHTQWLGDTHEKIAWDKAGIIKPATPCVTGTDHPGALEVIRDAAMANDAVLTEVTPDEFRVLTFGAEGQVVDLYGARGWYRDVKLNLLGHYQAANAALALRVLELAGIAEGAIREGFSSVSWPGRMELLVARGKQVLLDAAHNPAKCAALAQSVRDYFPERRVVLLLGVLADKEVSAMLPPLMALAAEVVVTTPPFHRKLEAEDLAPLCGRPVEVVPDVGEAVQAVLSKASPDDLIVITGSFYLVGPARIALRNPI